MKAKDIKIKATHITSGKVRHFSLDDIRSEMKHGEANAGVGTKEGEFIYWFNFKGYDFEVIT